MDPASAIKNAIRLKKIKSLFGSVLESIIRFIKIITCINTIQLFLCPYCFNIGIENLSTNGAHKNLKAYINVTQAKNPI